MSGTAAIIYKPEMTRSGTYMVTGTEIASAAANQVCVSTTTSTCTSINSA